MPGLPPPAKTTSRLHRAYTFVSEGNYRVAGSRSRGTRASQKSGGRPARNTVRRAASVPHLRTRSAEAVFPPRHESNRQYVPGLLSLDAAIAREAAKCERCAHRC